MDAEQLLKRYADGTRDFSWADLRGANLVGASLPGINLYRADLTGATLERADLRQANFLKANLTRTNLSQADLTGANLRRADLTRTVLTAAVLNGAHFSDLTLPQGLPSVPASVRQTASHSRPTSSSLGNQSIPAQRRRASQHPPYLPSFSRPHPPSISEVPLPSLALLWAGYCCFGGILGIHEVPAFLWFLVWATALTWRVDESLAWFIPVLAAIAVMLGSGLSLWALILAGSVSLGLMMGLLLLNWPLHKALKDSLWIGGLVAIAINLTLWLVRGNGYGLVISGYFPLALLLLFGMGGSGMGAIAWLQMHANGFKPNQIVWIFGGCAALGLLSGGALSGWVLPAL